MRKVKRAWIALMSILFLALLMGADGYCTLISADEVLDAGLTVDVQDDGVFIGPLPF